MTTYKSTAVYLQASLEGATHLDLLTMVYEALAADLRQASQALQDGDIQRRCAASNHALLLLGHIETWTEFLDDAALARSLQEFYAYLRGRIVSLQSKSSPRDFEKLSALVLEVRFTWHEKIQQLTLSPSAPAQASLPSSGEHNATRSVWFA